MEVLIGIDDTDSKESRGTGFRSRQMASELSLAGFGSIIGITRHQLLVHPDVPYTSQNSSNCVQVETNDFEGLKEFCRAFLFRESLPEADTGLCIHEIKHIPRDAELWGNRAKVEVLTQNEALDLAEKHQIYLEGLTGTKDGIIGALAAIGLRNGGNDGRFIWQPGKQLRDMTGTMTVGELLKGSQVDAVLTRDGKILEKDVDIDLTDWIRAVLIDKKAYILAERNLKKSGNDWKTADKEYIKSISS